MEKHEFYKRFPLPQLGDDCKWQCIDILRMGRELSEKINKCCPDCGEQDIAIRCAEEAVFWANAAIKKEKS